MNRALRIMVPFLVTFVFSQSLFASVAGPIEVSDNGRYFVDSHGKPFLWMGDTAWPLLVLYPREQAEAYLTNRAEKGFTVIQAVVIWGFGTGFETRTPQPNTQGEKPWLNDSPATPNDRYFENVDYLVNFANEHGLVLAMLPLWGYYVNDTGFVTPETARAYGRWLGKRYKDAPNVIWVNGGDRIATGFEETYRALALGLREGDSGTHLISYHPCGGRSSAQYFHDEDWLDFNMIETWTAWPKIYPAVLSDVVRCPSKPVVLAEGAYENGPEYPLGPITSTLVRRQAWWAFMAGGFFTYGQNQMWRMEEGWEKTFETPGAKQMAVYKEIITSFDWWNMMPNNWVFDSGISSEKSLNTAMCSVDGNRILVYVSTPCSFCLCMDRIAAKEAKATWINPATGERVDAGVFLTGNYNGQIFPNERLEYFKTPGFWEDALLLLEGMYNQN